MENNNTNSCCARVCETFDVEERLPDISPSADVHPLAAVIGNVHLGQRVVVSPAASVRGDEGQPIWIGDDVSIQDCVVLHALETDESGELREERVIRFKDEHYGIYIHNRVCLAHQCQIHGPVLIGEDTLIGMQSLVFKATIGQNCVLEPEALVMGVTIADNRYVPAGAVITTQAAADNLPVMTEEYSLRSFNDAVVHVNLELAMGYQAQRAHSTIRRVARAA